MATSTRTPTARSTRASTTPTAHHTHPPAYLVHHLEILAQAIADSVADVRGYYHWALMDNFEWASGYWPQFGLYGFDAKKRLVTRQSGRDYKRIAKGNGV